MQIKFWHFTTLAFLMITQANAQMVEPGTLTIMTHQDDDSIATEAVVLKWEGAIVEPMAESFQKAYTQYKHAKKRFILDISSPGGEIAEGDRVIAILMTLKKTHGLTSVVQRGATCASECVPIFLQGTQRIGARASTWMFHGARKMFTTVPDDNETNRNLNVFRDAGVSEAWIQSVLPYMRKPGEFWQTGSQLKENGSLILTQTLDDFRELPVVIPPFDPQLGPR